MRTNRIIPVILCLLAIATAIPLISFADGDDQVETIFEGTVTDDSTGDPIEGAEVSIMKDNRGYVAMTDEEGFYSVNVKKGGDYSFFVSAVGYHDEYTEETIVATETKTVDFQLFPYTATVEGTVTDEETGDPIARAYIEFRPTDNRGDHADTFTDVNGTFEVFLDPGTYEYQVKAHSYKMFEGEEFTIEDGETVELDIELERMGQGMLGVVLNGDDEPIEEASVVLRNDRGVFKAMTDEDGSYEIRCPPGEYNAVVYADGYMESGDRVEIEKGEMLEKDWVLEHQSPLSFIMKLLQLLWELLGL